MIISKNFQQILLQVTQLKTNNECKWDPIKLNFVPYAPAF